MRLSASRSLQRVLIAVCVLSEAAVAQGSTSTDSVTGPGTGCLDSAVVRHGWRRWTTTGAIIGASLSGAAVAVVALQARNRDANVSPGVVVVPAALLVAGSAAVGWGAGWVGYDLLGRRPVCPPAEPPITPPSAPPTP